MEVATY